MTRTFERDVETGGAVDRDGLRDLVHNSLSAEFASVRDGKPAVYPVTPYYDRERDVVAVTSPPAYAGKIENVRHDPRVALLLRDEEGEYLVIGDGHVRDVDIEANAEKDLIRNEPKTPKRAAAEEGARFMESRVGQPFFGWYSLRLVVDITPKSRVRLGEPNRVEELGGWEAANMDYAEASTYDRALLSFLDDDGSPVIEPLASLAVEDDGAILEMDGVPDLVRFVLDGRRRTKAHFRDQSFPDPETVLAIISRRSAQGRDAGPVSDAPSTRRAPSSPSVRAKRAVRRSRRRRTPPCGR